jgi:class 3 adenylate cyclase
VKTAKEIIGEVSEIFADGWEQSKGTKVPEAENLSLGNSAIKLDGTVLYADIVDSTELVDNFKDSFAAEVYKSYLVAASHIIRKNSGEITAFDGDRVMAVYVGSRKNSAAAKTALQLNWAVAEINKALKVAYPNTAFHLRHSVGVDTSSLLVAKTGIRNSNDLVWIGRAANYAAKLSALADESYGAVITESVFKKLSDASRNGGSPRQSMWGKSLWKERNLVVYESNWRWKP